MSTDKPRVHFGDDVEDEEEEIDYTKPRSPKSPKTMALEQRRPTPGVLQHLKPAVHITNIPTAMNVAAAFTIPQAPKPPPPKIPPEEEDVLAEIARLRENVSYMTANIELEAKRLNELDQVTQEMSTREWDSRKLMGGVFAPRDKEHHNAIYICILENRLEKEESLREIFSIQDEGNLIIRFVSKPYTKKYEKVIEIRAFMKTQDVLGLETKDIDPVLPELLAARARHAELLRNVQALNAEIESAAAARLGSFMDSSDDDEGNPFDDMFSKFTENDFLRLIKELKRQIYSVFKEVGLQSFDENLETAIMDGTVHDDSLELAISKLFSKTENFIEEISEPVGLNETSVQRILRESIQMTASLKVMH
ncbi:hypothetical protein R1sor_021912 [Riccia sorocarpa]|uniref:Uncharacterized protein n=1 Tax=Riccia sorocarpa TaxID=122646 RepID=A0ABD3GM63_9MARC